MADESPKKIAIILGSVRTPRIGPQAVEAINETFKKASSYSSVETTVLDLASFDLPVYNEKVMPAMVPAMAQFEHEHSKKFSAAIKPFDGYVFVSPEYNGGVPGGTKNAIDYLYNEWIGKPMFIVTYGIHGGSSSSLALRTIFEVMKLRVIPTRPELIWGDGGHGADLRMAMAKGILGEASKKAWLENEDLVKGFDELVEFVNDKEKKGTRYVHDRLGLP